uniref:Uncharacterized protein n=1 Tax=Anopheles epiroticus TaxID=199890 RepID=A0A182PH91_9DIPT
MASWVSSVMAMMMVMVMRWSVEFRSRFNIRSVMVMAMVSPVTMTMSMPAMLSGESNMPIGGQFEYLINATHLLKRYLEQHCLVKLALYRLGLEPKVPLLHAFDMGRLRGTVEPLPLIEERELRVAEMAQQQLTQRLVRHVLRSCRMTDQSQLSVRLLADRTDQRRHAGLSSDTVGLAELVQNLLIDFPIVPVDVKLWHYGHLHCSSRCTAHFTLQRTLLVHRQLQRKLQREALVLFAQPIHDHAAAQPSHKLIQQNCLQILAEPTVHGQFLQPSVPHRHRFTLLLARVVERRPLAEHSHLGAVLLAQQLAQLLEGAALGQHRMAKVAQRLVRIAANDRDEQGRPFALRYVIHFEELLQPLLVHVPIVYEAVKLRNRTDHRLTDHLFESLVCRKNGAKKTLCLQPTGSSTKPFRLVTKNVYSPICCLYGEGSPLLLGIMLLQRFIFLAQPIQNLSRSQSGDEFVQQNRLQVRAKLTVYGQFLEPTVPLGHVLSDVLRGVVEVCPLAEDCYLWAELFAEQLTQLLERAILRQGRVAQVPQALVCLAADAANQKGASLFRHDFVHLEELL